MGFIVPVLVGACGLWLLSRLFGPFAAFEKTLKSAGWTCIGDRRWIGPCPITGEPDAFAKPSDTGGVFLICNACGDPGDRVARARQFARHVAALKQRAAEGSAGAPATARG